LRIISGSAKGRRLTSFKKSLIRPTSDRIREAVFDILFSYKGSLVNIFPFQNVLDAFAGTGAFGIEAYSRGASKVTFIENNREVIKILTKNLEVCGFKEGAKILSLDIARALNQLKKKRKKFDLVFLDPPYDRSLVEDTVRSIINSDILKDDSLVVAEHSLNEMPAEKIGCIKLEDRRKYGTTMVSFYAGITDNPRKEMRIVSDETVQD
jgi:16S rRNA (guanine(966)-N(2))-methyltransferase RsmD